MRNSTVTQPSLVLVHSPLVGPLTWEPVAERLRRAGRVVIVPSLAGVTNDGPPYYRRLAGRVADEVARAGADGRVTLAGHSGAGALLPEAGLRERFVADLPELPLAYFYETAPQVACWPPAHCAYLRLSEPYDELADEAGRLGWPVRRENSDHLAMLTQPDRVAAILDRIV